MSSGSKRFPYFVGFLGHRAERPRTKRLTQALVVGIFFKVSVSACGFAVGLPLSRGAYPLGGLIGLAIGYVVGFLISCLFNVMARRPSPDEDPKPLLAWQAAKQYRALDAQNRLHKWVDPAAIELLEAAAYHWTRVVSALDSPFWTSKTLPTHWQAVRDHSLAAAEAAMDDLLILAQACIGQPAKDRKSELKGVFEGLIDLDIADALQGLKAIAGSDWQRYAFHSPNSRVVFEAGRQVAERLKLLGDEVERMAQQAAIETTGAQVGAPQSIDVVLTELKAVQQAEDELRQQTQGQG